MMKVFRAVRQPCGLGGYERGDGRRAGCGEAHPARPDRAGGQPGGVCWLRGGRIRWAGRAGRAGGVPCRQRAAWLAVPADAGRPVPGGMGGAAGGRRLRAGVAALAPGRRAGAGGTPEARPGAGRQAAVAAAAPGTTVPDAILRGVPHHGLSFTSGHAIITFAIAGLLVLVLPRRWEVVAFVLATCNGLARVFLGAHNPLDVVGGAAIGLAIAAVLDIVLDVARDRGRRPPGKDSRAREERAT